MFAKSHNTEVLVTYRCSKSLAARGSKNVKCDLRMALENRSLNHKVQMCFSCGMYENIMRISHKHYLNILCSSTIFFFKRSTTLHWPKSIQVYLLETINIHSKIQSYLTINYFVCHMANLAHERHRRKKSYNDQNGQSSSGEYDSVQ